MRCRGRESAYLPSNAAADKYCFTRLYVAPVESDIKGHSPSKSPANLRSAIRRTQRRSVDAAARSRRRALERYTASGQNNDPGAVPVSPPPFDIPGTASTSNPDAREGYQLRTYTSREQLLNSINPANLEDRIASFFSERVANLRAQSRTADQVPEYRERFGEWFDYTSPDHGAAAETRAASPVSGTSNIFFFIPLRPVNGAFQAAQPSRQLPRPPLPPPQSEDGPRWIDGRWLYPALRSSSRTGRTRRPARASRTRLSEARFDGLGDRNRSPSPGDAVWDTLLSTLTPDPQPPSVGSSFASAASASQVASQSAAASSSHTSITGPDLLEESTLEVPCEYSDSSADEEEEQNALRRFPPLRHRRSYADVAAQALSQNDDALEPWGGIGGMQRIVRSLADREDIPDEWWAEAGLSRTLSREAPN
jgi:hypothetical protein